MSTCHQLQQDLSSHHSMMRHEYREKRRLRIIASCEVSFVRCIARHRPPVAIAGDESQCYFLIADSPASVNVRFNAASSVVLSAVHRAMTRVPCARAVAIAFNCTVVGRTSAP